MSKINILSAEKAAEYCGMSVAALDHHVYRSKMLKPHYVNGEGSARFFLKEDLDAFLTVKRNRGRQKGWRKKGVQDVTA